VNSNTSELGSQRGNVSIGVLKDRAFEAWAFVLIWEKRVGRQRGGVRDNGFLVSKQHLELLWMLFLAGATNYEK